MSEKKQDGLNVKPEENEKKETQGQTAHKSEIILNDSNCDGTTTFGRDRETVRIPKLH